MGKSEGRVLRGGVKEEMVGGERKEKGGVRGGLKPKRGLKRLKRERELRGGEWVKGEKEKGLGMMIAERGSTARFVRRMTIG
ncbi:hypothetical protein [Neisseria sicca]|uniref:hypothetical protein n=1 Tax=Neisseria sicca TaxID=490 RepID=UPI0011BD16FE|nr:hypothetical protein [Neisseria sicca]